MGMTGEQAYALAKKLIEAGGGGGGTVDAYTKTQTDNLLKGKVDKEVGKGLFSGSYNDLTDAPNIPSKTSELQNDSGYLTEHQDLTQITEDIKNINDSLEIKNAIGTSFELITSQGGIRTNKILGNTHKSDDGVITSCGDSGSIEIKEHGKNLIPFPYYSGTSLVNNGITFTANEDGSVTANGTATSNAFFRFANKNMYSLENGKTYAISRGKTKDIYMFVQNSSGDFVVLKVDESAKFTCNDTWRYIGCYVPKDTTVTDETIYPMLVEVNEDGTYSTEYEQYKSSTTTIPLSEPLRAIGDVKDEITKDGIIRRIGTREYISGDELDSTIITDNTTTYYVLSIPTTEQLTNEQKIALNSLVSFKDKTYIETSDVYAKATLDLDYSNSDIVALVIESNNDVEKLKQAIVSLGGTVS